MRVHLDVVCMVGTSFALFPRDGAPAAFPTGELQPGERPQDGVRRLLDAWTGTADPKLELVDLRADGEDLALVFRAVLTEDPSAPHEIHDRTELPGSCGRLAAEEVREMLKTSLNYKLTRA